MPYVNGTRNESKIFPAVYLFLCDEILEGPVLSQAQVNSIKDNATALRAAKLESCQTDSTAEPITLSTGEEVSADSIIKVEITELDSENIEAIKAQIQNPCNILFFQKTRSRFCRFSVFKRNGFGRTGDFFFVTGLFFRKIFQQTK